MEDEKRTDLIARLESVTEGSRELDAEISVALEPGEIVWRQANFTMDASYPAIKRARSNYIGGFAFEHVPYYTTSLDAALTLVPKEPKNEPSGIYDYQLESTNGGLTISARVGNSEPCFAETIALALCIASLKAKDSTDGR